jgi:predicted ABC-type ATPase
MLPELRCSHFVNADLLARGLSPLGGNVDFQAGLLMMRQLRKLRDEGADFATESTLAARSLLSFIRECQDSGYKFCLFYFWLPSAEVAIQRVAARVRAGGHSVPDTVIRRRYDAGRRNFCDLYRPQADRWYAYDSSHDPVILARGEHGREHVLHPAIWKVMTQ